MVEPLDHHLDREEGDDHEAVEDEEVPDPIPPPEQGPLEDDLRDDVPDPPSNVLETLRCRLPEARHEPDDAQEEPGPDPDGRTKEQGEGENAHGSSGRCGNEK